MSPIFEIISYVSVDNGQVQCALEPIADKMVNLGGGDIHIAEFMASLLEAVEPVTQLSQIAKLPATKIRLALELNHQTQQLGLQVYCHHPIGTLNQLAQEHLRWAVKQSIANRNAAIVLH